jgi:hypothetical protein
MDIAGLSKLTANTITLIISVLGFMVREKPPTVCLCFPYMAIDLRFRYWRIRGYGGSSWSVSSGCEFSSDLSRPLID